MSGANPGTPVGERVRILRERGMLSQSELAQLAGINRGTIVNLETGRTLPQPATLRLLANALHLDEHAIHWLVTGEERPDPAPVTFSSGPGLETPFVGRDDEIAAIAAALANPALRLLTLTGPGGIGKTRLALEAAARVAPGFAAVTIVPLANLADPAEVLPAIANALRVPATSPALRDDLAAALHGQRRLLLLDNLEHLLPVVPDLAWLLRAAPGPVVLATSREALRMPGESVMVVDPLATAGADAPAVDLFLRLAALSAGLSPTWDAARDAPAIREICSRLGGFPLALELAAAQMDVLGPADLLDFMREAGLGVLATTTTDDLRRFSTMDAAIGWSVDRLAPEDQRLLRLLAVFPGGFGAPAAADLLSAVYPDTPGATAQVAASLGRLTRAHLVRSRQRSTASGGMTSHFHMLEPIRLFALDRLRAEGGLAAARRAHAVTVADRIAALDRQIRDNRMGLVEEVEREYPDGRAALDWALESGDADLASRLISALKYVHSFRYRAAGLLAQFDRLLERSPALTAHARLWAHYERAELASRERDLPRLREALLAALADAEAVDDPLLGAMALLFWSCDLDEDPRDALATIERARVLLGEDGDTADPSFLQSWLLIRQGVELHRLGRMEEARAALEAGVARKQAEDHEIGNGPPLAHLGRLQMDLGLPRQAADTLLQALDLADTLSDGWLRFHAARWLAEVARRGGPEAQAIADLLDAAVAAEFAAHAYVLGPGESLPEAPHIEQPALPLPEAIRLAGNLPSLLPEQDDPVPNARYTGQRLE